MNTGKSCNGFIGKGGHGAILFNSGRANNSRGDCDRRFGAVTVVQINWYREKWSGAGPEPDGRARGAEYHPCEEVRAYLAKDGNGYRTIDSWNGRKLIGKARTYLLPDRVWATVRCQGR